MPMHNNMLTCRHRHKYPIVHMTHFIVVILFIFIVNVDMDLFLSPSSHQSTNYLSSLQWKATLLESEVIPLSNSCSAASASSGLNYSNLDILLASFGHDNRFENGQSLLAAEVKSITHMPHHSKIIVQLKRGLDLGSKDAKRLCTNPFFVGRLSGPYLSRITSWKKVILEDNGANVVDQIIGHYHVPTPGTYFLEIIGVLYNDITFETDYKDICLENPIWHRITHESASIKVIKHNHVVNTDKEKPFPKGYWKWAHEGFFSSDEKAFEPLFTRYQPIDCRDQTKQSTVRCSTHMSLERFNPYQFVFSTNQSDDTQMIFTNTKEEENKIKSRELLLNNGKNDLKLCFVGLLHAREMTKAVNIWLQSWNITSHIRATNIDAQFPRMINQEFINKNIINNECTKTVIAAGQWSAGKKPPGSKFRNLPPTLFPEYFTEVKNMLLSLKTLNTTNFFLRSIHYNSLGDLQIMCPPEDWRSPSVIDGYNSILRNLTTVMNVPFIDTNFIIGPMWDSAGDFCHYRDDKVAEAEALYVLGNLV